MIIISFFNVKVVCVITKKYLEKAVFYCLKTGDLNKVHSMLLTPIHHNTVAKQLFLYFDNLLCVPTKKLLVSSFFIFLFGRI